MKKEGIMAKFAETSIPAVFHNRVEQFGDRAIVAYKKDGVYTDISWKEMGQMVRNLGYFLINKGIKPGDKVCLFSPNRYEWWVTDLAILSIGAVNVPIYATNSAEESRYIIDNSDAVMCFTATKEHTSKIVSVKPKLPNLKDIISFDPLEKPIDGVLELSFALKEGAKNPQEAEFDKRIRDIKSSEMATIIYTSGTTETEMCSPTTTSSRTSSSSTMSIPNCSSGPTSSPSFPSCRWRTPSSAPWATTPP